MLDWLYFAAVGAVAVIVLCANARWGYVQWLPCVVLLGVYGAVCALCWLVWEGRI